MGPSYSPTTVLTDSECSKPATRVARGVYGRLIDVLN